MGVGQVATVTFSLGGYAGSTEADSFNFDVSYDPNIFAFVSNSVSLGSSSGADQQWLSKAPQEPSASGFLLTNASNALVPGYVFVAVGDMGFNYPERGTLAGSGFLISFQLRAISPGNFTVKGILPGG
jgi:hypothetical protein